MGHRQSKVLSRVQILFSLAVILPLTITAFFSYLQVKTSLLDQAHERLYTASKFHGNVLIGRLGQTALLVQNLEASTISEAPYWLTELEAHTDFILEITKEAAPTSVLGREFTLRKNSLTDHIPEKPGDKSRVTHNGEDEAIWLEVHRQDSVRFIAQINKSYLFGENEDRLLNNNFCVFEGSAVLYCTESLTSELANLRQLDHGTGYAGNLQWKSADRHYFATARELFVRAIFDSADWTVVSVEDSDTVFAPIRIFRWLFPGLITLTILSMLVIVMAQTRRQLTPISVLREGALKLGARAFETRIVLDSNDEFAELAGAFNGMADNLEAQFKFLTAMSEIDRALLASTDIMEIIELVASRLPELLPATAVVAVNNMNNSQHAKLFISKGHTTSTSVNQDIALDTFFSTMGSTRDYYTICPEKQAPEFLTGIFSNSKKLHLFPLRYEQHCLACLYLSSDNEQPLTAEVVDQAKSVADRLTVALSATERQRKLYKQAHYDGLTGLPNRTLFLERLRHSMTQASRKHTKVALIYIDLDHFKLVNDTLGHSQGDEVLRQAADRFRSSIRQSDTLARLSGDEFAVALPELTSAQSAVKVAEILIAELTEPFQLMDQKFTIGASIGIAIYPDDAGSAEELLKNSDVAMYRAKAELGNRYQFYEKNMNNDLVERSSIGQRLRESVKNKQLHLVYQPKVRAACATLHSAEALLRWHDSELGWVSPEKFISIAEEIGIIEEIGEFVLNSACDQFVAWQAAGLPISQIAVNVSPRQILYTDIVATVAQVLDRTGLAGDKLELEITESLMINDYNQTHETLSGLKKLGVGLALDDFGTGYSCLSHLHELPFDTLKIDKSFVDHLGTGEDADVIILSIIALAKSLNKTIVAEGIEHQEQQQFLVHKGCDLLQGYLFSKPLSVENITSMLMNSGQTPLVLPRVRGE
jgi:diguanylate cyclase (GGDEF)-like protein